MFVKTSHAGVDVVFVDTCSDDTMDLSLFFKGPLCQLLWLSALSQRPAMRCQESSALLS